jgi:transforming growth factor-beta-induced protein
MMVKEISLVLTSTVLCFGAACGDDKPAINNNVDGGLSVTDAGDTDALQPDSGDFAITLMDRLADDPDLSTLLGAVQSANLSDVLSETEPLTLFAPTNAAFDALPDGVVAGLSSAELSSLLTFHVAGGSMSATSVAGSTEIVTQDGARNILVQDFDGDIVLNGTTQLVSGGTDIQATNGMIHKIDSVMFDDNGFPGDVVEAVSAYPIFSKFTKAVTDADVASDLQTPAALTLFAPTDKGFEGIALQALPDGALEDVVRFHAVSGTLEDGDLASLPSVTAIQGDPISIEVIVDSEGMEDDVIRLDDTADITFTNLTTSNGIIHIIDRLLLPPLS